jgi:hypothetical protein
MGHSPLIRFLVLTTSLSSIRGTTFPYHTTPSISELDCQLPDTNLSHRQSPWVALSATRERAVAPFSVSSIATTYPAHPIHSRTHFFVRLCTQDGQENWKRQDTPQDTGIGILIWNFFFTYSGQHPPEQDPRPVPYPRLR